MSYDDASRLRRDGEGEEDDWTRQERPSAIGAPCMVAKTVAVSSYPTSASCYFGVQPQSTFGTEAEGAAGSSTPTSFTAYALNLGTTIPPVGTQVLCTYVGNRWVFRFDS